MGIPYRIGWDARIDPGVILGYLSGRPIANLELIIGEGARIRSNTVIYAGTRIGHNLETGHNVVIREENLIGDDFSIWTNSIVDYRCEIGHRVKIQNGVYISQYTVIEDDVSIGPGAATAFDLHPECGKCRKGPIIRRGARIGVNATILPHVIVGEDALVAGGSVVTRDVPPASVAYGNPARVRGSIYDLECKVGIDKPYPRR